MQDPSSTSAFSEPSQNVSASLRLSRAWSTHHDAETAHSNLASRQNQALESLVYMMQQSGLRGPLVLIGEPEYIGQGSQFIVYKQRLAMPEYESFSVREVAAKLPKFHLDPDQELSLSSETARKQLNDIYLEVHALTIPALASHPNIARLFGWSTDPDSFHEPLQLIMELARCNLQVLLSDEYGTTSEDERCSLCCHISAGIDALHDHGLVHGDLKPENVLIFFYGVRKVAKIADFGLSVNEMGSTGGVQSLGGTQGWMAPEVERQSLFEPQAMCLADNYSFGLVAWSLALHSGRPPPGSITQTQRQLAKQELRSAGNTNHHDMYRILEHAADSLLQPEGPRRPFYTCPLLDGLSKDLNEDNNDNLSETSLIAPQEAPNPFPDFRYFDWELPPFSDVFLSGLYTRLIDSPSTISPEVQFAMFLAFSPDGEDERTEQQKALNALVAASVTGYEHAQAVVRPAYAFYQRSMPQVVEDRLDRWEFDAAASGSPLAQNYLYQHDRDNYSDTRKCFQAGGGFNFYYSDIKLDSTVDPRTTGDDGVCHVHRLAIYGSLSQMQEWLDGPAMGHIDSMTSSDETALYLASARGHYQIAATLIRHGANPSFGCTSLDITPLHWLFAFDVDVQPQVVTLLIGAGADIDARASKPMPFFHYPFLLPAGTPLHWAVVTNSHTAVRALIEHGADVYVRDGSDPYTWDDRVRILNKFGGPNKGAYSFSEEITEGLSPLDYAAAQQDPFIFEFLLASGRTLNMDAVDEEGFSVFHRLSTSHVHHTIQGNSFSIRPFLGSPQEMKIRADKTVKAIKLLGGNIDLLTTPRMRTAQSLGEFPSVPSYTPLMLASMNGNLNIIKALLGNGAAVDAQNQEGETAALCLFQSDGSTDEELKLECLKVLVSAGANINHRSNSGTTLIIAASSSHDVDEVDFCLSMGASIDERVEHPDSNDMGSTVLHMLANEDPPFRDDQDLAVLELLEKHLFSKPEEEQKRTINAVNEDSETILHKYSSYGMKHCVSALLIHGAHVNALKNCYTQEHEDETAYKISWQETPLDCVVASKEARAEKMQRDRCYANRGYRDLMERDESLIQSLVKAGGVQAPKDRERKIFQFDPSRCPQGERLRMYLQALREC